jgi:phage terminase large subunit-like protein
MPAKESVVKRLNFCVWTDAESPWISGMVWLGAKEEVNDDIYLGRRCYGGLDLSAVQDLTAFALLFEPTDTDPVWRLRVWFWLPGDGLREKSDKDRVPYLMWRDQGHLFALKGATVNKAHVLQQIVGAAERYDIQAIAYDRWRIDDITQLMDREGIELPELVAHGQGFKDMAPAVDRFEGLLLSGELKHDGNPVLTWNAANAVTAEDPAGNRKLAKDRSTGRIDGIVAGVMAAGICQGADKTSIYDERDPADMFTIIQ